MNRLVPGTHLPKPGRSAHYRVALSRIIYDFREVFPSQLFPGTDHPGEDLLNIYQGRVEAHAEIVLPGVIPDLCYPLRMKQFGAQGVETAQSGEAQAPDAHLEFRVQAPSFKLGETDTQYSGRKSNGGSRFL